MAAIMRWNLWSNRRLKMVGHKRDEVAVNGFHNS